MSTITDQYNIARKTNPSLTLADFVKGNKTTPPIQTVQPPTPISTPSVSPSFLRDKAREEATTSKLGLSGVDIMQLAGNPSYEKQLFEMTYKPEELKNLKAYQDIVAKDQERTGIGSQMAQMRQSMPGAMLALEDALRTKNDVGNQPIGESELFKKAGLTGIFSLNESLAQNAKDMEYRYGSFLNALSRVGQFQASQYKGLGDQYKMLTEEYNQKQAEMSDILKQVQQHQDAMDLAEQEFDLWKKKEEFSRSLEPTAQEKVDMKLKGFEYVDGNYVPEGDIQAVFGTVGNKNDSQFKECAYFSNRATNADQLGKHVGNSWESKIKMADTIVRQSPSGLTMPQSFNFQSGNTLYIPMGKYGHTAVITSYNPETGDVNVIERNVNMDGKTTTGIYNVLDLQKKYGEWGVAKTSWKPELIAKMGQSEGDLEAFNRLDNSQKISIRTIAGKFGGEQIVKDYNSVANKVQSVSGIIDQGVGGPGDLAIVFEFMKGLDPTSVVRESEYEAAAKSGNIFRGALAKFNGYLKEEGGFLPENVKESFRKIIQTKFDVIDKQYTNLFNQYSNKINSFAGGANVAPNVLIDYRVNFGTSESEVGEETKIDQTDFDFYNSL